MADLPNSFRLSTLGELADVLRRLSYVDFRTFAGGIRSAGETQERQAQLLSTWVASRSPKK